jgi:hypothetical protein
MKPSLVESPYPALMVAFYECCDKRGAQRASSECSDSGTEHRMCGEACIQDRIPARSVPGNRKCEQGGRIEPHRLPRLQHRVLHRPGISH